MSLYQHNDQEILVPIVDGLGSDVDLSAITNATYKMFTRDRSVEVLSKQLNSGITRASNVLTITITKEDSAQLRGTYYHEISITDPVKGLSTVLKNTIYIEPTEI